MPEMIFGIPLKLLFAIIVLLVAMAFAISYLFLSKDAAERAISVIGGVLRSFAR